MWKESYGYTNKKPALIFKDTITMLTHHFFFSLFANIYCDYRHERLMQNREDWSKDICRHVSSDSNVNPYLLWLSLPKFFPHRHLMSRSNHKHSFKDHYQEFNQWTSIGKVGNIWWVSSDYDDCNCKRFRGSSRILTGFHSDSSLDCLRATKCKASLWTWYIWQAHG